MKFIGITGGVGAGKSALLEYIRKHYLCRIYLADEVAHLVKQKGTDCYEKLVECLGPDVLDEDGEIDKKKMAAKIFSDDALLKKVNSLIHPAVKEYLLEQLRILKSEKDVELFFVEAALLIETGYKALVDEMWYIYADENVRRDRLMKSRGYTSDKVDSIMKQQLSEEKFREAADFVIDNSSNLEDAYHQIDKKLEAYTWRE